MKGTMNLTEPEQVRLVERGEKPIALVQAEVQSKLPYIPLTTYTCILDPETDIVTHVIPNSERIYHRPETQAAAQRLHELMVREMPEVGEPAAAENPPEWHREVGRLFGYTEAEIDSFV
jgi:hypothetical protein